MRITKYLAIAAVAALALGGFAITKLQAVEAGRPQLRGQILHRIMEELQLSDEQLGKIKAELRAEKETLVPMLKQLHETRKALRETIQSDADEAAVRAAHAKVAAVEADLAVERAKLHKKIAPILTDEQIVKVKAIEEKIDDFAIKALKAIGDRLGEDAK